MRRLRTNIEDTVTELGITAPAVKRVMDTALELARQQPLRRFLDDPVDGWYAVSPLTESGPAGTLLITIDRWIARGNSGHWQGVVCAAANRRRAMPDHEVSSLACSTSEALVLAAANRSAIVDGATRPASTPGRTARAAPVQKGTGQPISEDAVKAAVRDYLAARDLHVEVRWGRDRGVDITATGPNERWIIEAKGEALSPQQQGNYFLGALGELIQRMDDPHARYALALPDTPRCRGLVRRLPNLARQRLALTAFFVHRDGTVTQDPEPR